MTDGHPEPATKAAHAKGGHARRFFARLGLVLASLLLLLVVFYRPLITAAAIRIAATQNIDLKLEIRGTILTNISLLNIRATPNGKGPTPVENISIDEVTVGYSIPSLLRHGVSEFLTSYRLRNGTIAVKPVEGSRAQKSDLASTLHELIQQPALFSNRVEIDNLNLRARVPDGTFALEGLNLTLDPARPGALDIALLQVPRVRTWHDLHATSSYARRDMILRGLELDPQIVIQQFELDASRRAEGINRLDVQGALFGGDASFSLIVTQLPGRHANKVSKALAQIDSTISYLSLEKISRYFNSAAPAVGTLRETTLHLEGDPNTPSSWTGAMTADAAAIRAGSSTLDEAATRLDVSHGWATLSSSLFAGSNSVSLDARGRLPDSLDGFAGSAIDGSLRIAAPDLHHTAPPLASGTLGADGEFHVRSNGVRASILIRAGGLAAGPAALESGSAQVDLAKRFPADAQAAQGSNPLEGLDVRIDAAASGLSAAGLAVDSLSAAVTVHDRLIELHEATATRAFSSLAASGTVEAPADLSSWSTAPATFAFMVHSPALAAFNAGPGPAMLDGSAEASGTLSNGPAGINGSLSAALAALRFRGFAADGLDAAVSIRDSVATIRALRFALNPTDGFSASGEVDLRAPYAYAGSAKAQVRDLSKFAPLLSASAGSVAGALNLDWSGSGDLETLRSQGAIAASLANGRFRDLQSIRLALSGTYSPTQLDFPTFTLSTSKGGLSAVISARSDLLRVSALTISQAGRALLTGSLAFPLDLRTPAQPGTLIPASGPIFASITSGTIPIEAFFAKGKAPAAGTAAVTLNARGSLDEPDLRLTVTGRNLRATAPAAAPLGPASLDAAVVVLGNNLSIKARLAQPQISTLDVAGSLPLPLNKVLRTGTVDPATPIRLSVRLPRTSLSPLTRLAPAVRYIQGDAQVSLDAAGTLAKPTLNGALLADIPAIRLANPDMPAVSDFHADIALAGQQVTVRRLGGQLSGGSFGLTGSVLFADSANPRIDLRFSSKDALLLRNDTVTVRSDADVRVAGPLASASVTGDIGITQSRFFKQIDILPLELPGRAPPTPPQLPATSPSIDVPPLRDWKFALKIHTRDPFVIQGNLANGQALVDLNLGGTGKAPILEGTVRIENFVASLPFSKLRVTNGFVYFSKDNPFVPQLNIQAQSTLQDYNISVLIYGSANDPKSVMSSEPPLPQEDIVALLATGATSANLSNGNALAGRAAILLLRSAYHKVFKSKAPPSTDEESFTSRFKVDVGGVDARTGQQEINSRFKLSDSLYLIGDLDVGGDIRGLIRYLIRFR